MRICIDLTSLADNFSGIERYAASITYQMINTSNDDFILIFKGNVHGLFKQIIKKRTVKYVILKRCNKLLFNQIRLPLAVYKIKADWYLFLAFPVPVLLFKKNMVSTIHDICCWDCPDTMNGMSNLYFKISHRVAILKCKKIITISRFSEKRIIDRVGCKANKLVLIYCGVDNKFLDYKIESKKCENVRKKYNLPQDYILSLSTLEPRKNLKLLINVYRELVLSNKLNTQLVLAGRRGWKIDTLLEGIEEDVIRNIIFTDFIDELDLPVIYSCARFFVFPSKYEGFGMPPLEAMACGTLVLSSDAASLPEVLGDAAMYFHSEEKEDLSRKLQKINAIDRENNECMIKRGLTQARDYNWSSEANKLLELLHI